MQSVKYLRGLQIGCYFDNKMIYILSYFSTKTEVFIQTFVLCTLFEYQNTLSWRMLAYQESYLKFIFINIFEFQVLGLVSILNAKFTM